MSWSGFKKAVNRGGTTLLQKTGQVERTNDTEFTELEQKYRILEKNSTALHKEAKSYLDSIRTISASSSRVATTIESFYGNEPGDQAMAATAYKRAVDDFETDVSNYIDVQYRSTVLEPVGRLCSYWPEVNNSITKRNKKLLDYDAARSKVRKMEGKTTEDPVKVRTAENELEQSQEVYETMNHALMKELPEIIELRVPYLDPSFECMVRMQTFFAEDGYNKLAGVQRYFAENVRDDYASGALDGQVENCLQEMRELTIVGS